MWSGQRGYRSGKVIALADVKNYSGRDGGNRKHREKLSCTMAMVLGALVTLELLVVGAMLLNIDFHSADRLALIFGTALLYFGVVAALTDR